MSRPSRAVLLAAALLMAACSAAAPTPTPTSVLTPVPTPAATPAPTEPPNPTAALTVTELLTGYAHPDLQDSCAARANVYDTELGSVTCGPEDLVFDFSLFELAAAMDFEFDNDVDGAETPPEADGTCAEGNYLSEYDVDGRVGRVNCREHTSSSGAQYHVIEWTDSNLLVIGYISNRVDLHTWDELIDFWLNQAGPFAP